MRDRIDTQEESLIRRELRRRCIGIDEPDKELGRFRIIRVLGRGGMSIVYEAYDPQLQRHVALKMLNSHYRAKDHTRLTREGIALARVSHPHIVQVYEAGEIDGKLYLSLELIDGVPLSQWLESGPATDAVLAVLVPLLGGLTAVHSLSEGLVHRDIKPSNILISGGTTAHLIDFGIARHSFVGVNPRRSLSEAASRSTASLSSGDTLLSLDTSEATRQTEAYAGTRTRWAGTSAYMSPEQIQGAPLDGRSDLFSYCIVLWEAIYGAHPFPRTPDPIRRNLGELRVPSRDSWLKRLLYRPLCRGLSADPCLRFQTAAELEHALMSVRSRRSRAVKFAAVVGVASSLSVWSLYPSAVDKCTAEGGKKAAELVASAQLHHEKVADEVHQFASGWMHSWDRVCDADEPLGISQRQCLLTQHGIISSWLERTSPKNSERSELRQTTLPSPDECEVPLSYVRVTGRPPRIDESTGVYEQLRVNVGALEMIGRAESIEPEILKLLKFAADSGDKRMLAQAQYDFARISRSYLGGGSESLIESLRHSENNALASQDVLGALRATQEGARIAILDAEDVVLAGPLAERGRAYVQLLPDDLGSAARTLSAAQYNVEGCLAYLQKDYESAESSHRRALLELGRAPPSEVCPWTDAEIQSINEIPTYWYEVARSLHNWGRAVSESPASDIDVSSQRADFAFQCARRLYDEIYGPGHRESIETMQAEAQLAAEREEWMKVEKLTQDAQDVSQKSGSLEVAAQSQLARAWYLYHIGGCQEIACTEARCDEAFQLAAEAEETFQELGREAYAVDARRIMISLMPCEQREVDIRKMIYELRSRGKIAKCNECLEDAVEYGLGDLPACEVTSAAVNKPA